jgi:hypothetical protein
MLTLLSAPPEIISHIFHSCYYFFTLLALASSCKHMHNVWQSEAPSLIWHLAPSHILAFDDALMAVKRIPRSESKS